MAGRAGLSDNWRMKSDILPQDNGSAVESSGHRYGWGSQQHKDFNVETKRITAENRGSATTRGEDDPRTLQAISEGRRLYVGNMPYMAKTQDVAALFASQSYTVYACFGVLKPCD